MKLETYLQEFAADWKLLGKAASTVEMYCVYLRQLGGEHSADDVTLAATKLWLADSASTPTAIARAKAVRAFGRWAEDNDGPDWSWWKSVPTPQPRVVPQPTVSVEDYRRALTATRRQRDRLVIELLWSTGLRLSELARIDIADIDLAGGFVVVPRTKTNRPRVAPLSEPAVRLCRRFVGEREAGPLLGMTSHAIQLLLRRLGAPTPHAWRRGWAVEALRNGVSEASVKAAAGWSSGAMVARYTSAVSGELAIAEFRRTLR